MSIQSFKAIRPQRDTENCCHDQGKFFTSNYHAIFECELCGKWIDYPEFATAEEANENWYGKSTSDDLGQNPIPIATPADTITTQLDPAKCRTVDPTIYDEPSKAKIAVGDTVQVWCEHPYYAEVLEVIGDQASIKVVGDDSAKGSRTTAPLAVLTKVVGHEAEPTAREAIMQFIADPANKPVCSRCEQKDQDMKVLKRIQSQVEYDLKAQVKTRDGIILGLILVVIVLLVMSWLS